MLRIHASNALSLAVWLVLMQHVHNAFWVHFYLQPPAHASYVVMGVTFVPAYLSAYSALITILTRMGYVSLVTNNATNVVRQPIIVNLAKLDTINLMRMDFVFLALLSAPIVPVL